MFCMRDEGVIYIAGYPLPNRRCSVYCRSNDDRTRKVFRSRRNVSSDGASRSQIAADRLFNAQCRNTKAKSTRPTWCSPVADPEILKGEAVETDENGEGKRRRFGGRMSPSGVQGPSPGRESPDAENVSKNMCTIWLNLTKNFNSLVVCRLQPTLKRFHLEANSTAQFSRTIQATFLTHKLKYLVQTDVHCGGLRSHEFFFEI